MTDNQPSEMSAAQPPERMRCLEVWGGNRGTDKQLEMPGLRAWVYSRPHGTSLGGGDVYYLSSCASGRISRVLLADVSGHGELVSALGMGLRDLMRRNVNWVKQTRLVRAMNRQFTAAAEQGGFATAIATTFFSPSRSLSVCNAGHPAPLIYRRVARQWDGVARQPSRPGRPTNLPLGVVEEVEYAQIEMVLDPGDLVLLVSDAFTDARNAEGQAMGEGGLLQIVTSLDAEAPELFIPRLLQTVESQFEGNLTEDDTTVLLLQATGTHIRFRENLYAPLRLLRGVADATDIG